MFLWTKPLGLKTFGQTAAQAESSKVLAANQGLYNGFLAMGLLWSFFEPLFHQELQYFFLGCVTVAGIFGAITVSPRILFVQALPAAIGLLLIYFF